LYTELDIIKGCKNNSSSAQQLLYTRYAPALKSVCMRYVKDKDDAKDVLHDSFIKIFNQIGKYKGEGSFEGWLKRIVINMALDHVKKNQKNKFVSSDNFDLAEKEESTETSSDVLLNAGFSADDLLAMLQNIQTDYALVFNMFYIDKLNHKEISELLVIDENTSRTRLFRAKVQLKKELEKQLTKLRKN
jgi:RNA polymerase sigma-70 factor (ECF subfamily)